MKVASSSWRSTSPERRYENVCSLVDALRQINNTMTINNKENPRAAVGLPARSFIPSAEDDMRYVGHYVTCFSCNNAQGRRKIAVWRCE